MLVGDRGSASENAMLIPKQTAIPALVRVKPGALDRMGIYAERHAFTRVKLFFSQDFDEQLIVSNGWKQPASHRRSNRTFTPSYLPEIVSRKSRLRSISDPRLRECFR